MMYFVLLCNYYSSEGVLDIWRSETGNHSHSAVDQNNRNNLNEHCSVAAAWIGSSGTKISTNDGQ